MVDNQEVSVRQKDFVNPLSGSPGSDDIEAMFDIDTDHSLRGYVNRNDLGIGNSELDSVWFEDFLANTATLSRWAASNSGSGTNVSDGWRFVTTGTQAVGCLNLETGTTASGYSSMHTWNNVCFVNNGAAFTYKARVAVLDLATASEDYRVEVGFSNNWDDAVWPADSIVFRYDRATHSASNPDNWRAVTRHDETETETDTGVAVAEVNGGDSMQVLRIEVSEDGSEVTFYIDDTLVATHTDDIPGNNDRMGLGQCVLKSAGTTERFVGFDYTYFRAKFSSAR